MKVQRVIPLILLICLAMSMQGCGGAVWSVDFTTATYIDDWVKLDWFSPWEGELHGTDGLWLDGKVFISPVGFDGDFTLDIIFSIKALSIVPGVNFTFYYSNAHPLEWINFNFQDIGAAGEYFYATENDPYRLMASESGPLGFKIGGNNDFTLKKSGNNLTVSLNGDKLYSGNFTSYSFDAMFPTLSVDQEDYSYEVFIKSIRVEFSGNVYTWH